MKASSAGRPAFAIDLAREVGRGLDPGIGEHHQAVEWVLDEGRDGDDRDVLAAGEEHFGVVGDAEGIASGPNGLEHGGGIGGTTISTSSPASVK